VPGKEVSEIVVCISDTSVGSLRHWYRTVLRIHVTSLAAVSCLCRRCQIWLQHSGKHAYWQNYFKLWGGWTSLISSHLFSSHL